MNKKDLFAAVDKQKNDLLRMGDYICDNPEIGLKEYKASALLSEYLRQNGYETQLGVGGLDTAFRAEWKNGGGGPSIGLLCEYDALDGIGHGCGHHLQGPAIVGAAVALKNNLPRSMPCRIVVYGTPAEETEGGKIIMLENGCFKDIDLAMMTHASSGGTGVDLRTMALSTFSVEYKGQSSHAAIRPECGRSALDALILAFNAIEFMREHVADALCDNGWRNAAECSSGACGGADYSSLV